MSGLTPIASTAMRPRCQVPSSNLGDYIAYGSALDPALLNLIAEVVVVKFP